MVALDLGTPQQVLLGVWSVDLIKNADFTEMPIQ